MDPQQIVELAKLLKSNGDKILNSEFALTLSGSILRALNDSFTLIVDSMECGDAKNFQVLKTINSKSSVFRDLQLIYDFVQKTPQLCIVHYPREEYFPGNIDIKKFRALKRLEVQKIHIHQIVGIQPLRAQLEYLICNKSLQTVDDIITNCGGDNSNGFVWNELKSADFSYNQLQTVDTSLEFAQFLQHLNLRHNQLFSVKAIKWLPNLKTLDLSFNRLTQIPQFHMDAYKRLQTLNMSNNLVEELTGIVRLDALTELDLSDNCLLDHSYLSTLSALITLKFLNLYGNPLHYHPKHRLATAQYLHKNCASVKFILDYEPLTKNEKSVTGTQKIRKLGVFNRFIVRSSSSGINTPSRLSSNAEKTPASSIGSLRSFKLSENGSASEDLSATIETKVIPLKKKVNKTRTVEFEDNSSYDLVDETSDLQRLVEAKNISQPLIIDEKQNQEYLDTKRHIETLRKKYGNEWLQADNAEMINSAMGIEPSNTFSNINVERHTARKLFSELLQNVTITEDNQAIAIHNSTPILTISNNNLTSSISPIKIMQTIDNQEASLYENIEQSAVNESKTETLHQSIERNETNESECGDNNSPIRFNKSGTIINIYSSVENNESESSEPEEDEETYIVYTSDNKDAIFLTKSSNFLRERDPLTERTKTKWSLKILESCDRLKSNTLRINFDTVKKDKQERVYTVEEDLCQELEKKLRFILSQRDLYEMNQTVYRCVNCNCQFSQEGKKSNKFQEIRCPDCKSTFVAEIDELSKSLDKPKYTERVSPAADIVKELPNAFITPPIVEQESYLVANEEPTDDDNSIGKGKSTFTAKHTQMVNRSLKQITKSSANSLNASSSISQITSNNSDSSLNSNQTCFIDSSTNLNNNNRIENLKTNGESDIDIISNPSQSSIEVLDRDGNRKISEERHICQAPHVEAIDNFSNTRSTFERQVGNFLNERDEEERLNLIVKKIAKPETTFVSQVNLTESSSSGSFTDSICTAYEQQAQKSANKTKELLQLDAKPQLSDNLTLTKEADGFAIEKDESIGLSSKCGAFFQSTNILMSSSKKLNDAENAAAKGSSNGSCQPYKFNYTDFNDIDHRLKLYFYQTKFEEKDEHFKWTVKGRIYSQQSSNTCNGLVVMSTCKFYLMEAYASENDDVKKWLRPIMSCTVDRLQRVQLLPWKIGLAFQLRDWGSFLLLLHDISRTNSLLLHFANNSLPAQCDLIYQPAEKLVKSLVCVVGDEQLKMFCLLNGCDVTCDNAKRSFQLSGLFATDSRLYLTSHKLLWLCADNEHDTDIELCVMQLMSNLVEIERPTENIALINFLDETHNKCELWRCSFETKDLADSFLNAVAQSWEKLFGVPLFNA